MVDSSFGCWETRARETLRPLAASFGYLCPGFRGLVGSLVLALFPVVLSSRQAKKSKRRNLLDVRGSQKGGEGELGERYWETRLLDFPRHLTGERDRQRDDRTKMCQSAQHKDLGYPGPEEGPEATTE